MDPNQDLNLAAHSGNPMNRSGEPSGLWKDITIVLAVALAARIIFMVAMPSYIESIDAQNWGRVADILQSGANPYQTTDIMAWPPFWLQVIFLLSKISSWLSVPFFRVLQSFLILVEAGVIVLLVKLIRQIAPGAPVRLLLILGIALNPAAILLICQHCNFDVIVALWVLLFVLNLIRYSRTDHPADWLAACFFLGLGILTKTVPLILAPMLAGGFRTVTRQAKFLGVILLLGPAFLGMSIVYVLSPDSVTSHVLKYRSIEGFFGLSGLIQIAGLNQLTPVYNMLFYALLLAAIAGIAALFWRRHSFGGPETVLLTALLLACVPALGPGYTPQYLYWYLPLFVATYAFYQGSWRAVLIGFGLIAACTYLFEYAILGPDGASLINIVYIGKQDHQEAVSLVNIFGRFQSASGQTVMRLPLFAAYLVLFFVGIKIFLRRIKQS